MAYSLGGELVGAEAARPTDNPDAMDFILRGHALMFNPPTRDNFAAMISQLERAVALDPRSVVAMSYLTTALMGRMLNGMSDSPAADIERAEGLVGRALAAAPRNPLVHLARGFLLRAQNRVEEAIPEYETAIAGNRNAAVVLHNLADCKLKVGSIEEIIPLEEQSIRLNPRDPRLGHFYFRIGHVRLLQSRTDEAIVRLEKARAAVPGLPFVRMLLASAYGLKGKTERAAAELAEARKLIGGDGLSSIAKLKAFPGGYGGYGPKTRALIDATYIVGLRRAGMPEE